MVLILSFYCNYLDHVFVKLPDNRLGAVICHLYTIYIYIYICFVKFHCKPNLYEGYVALTCLTIVESFSFWGFGFWFLVFTDFFKYQWKFKRFSMLCFWFVKFSNNYTITSTMKCSLSLSLIFLTYQNEVIFNKM